jgi:hypothetical protein
MAVGTAAGIRTAAGMTSELARPMTAIHGAGYSSAGKSELFLLLIDKIY